MMIEPRSGINNRSCVRKCAASSRVGESAANVLDFESKEKEKGRIGTRKYMKA